VKHGYVRLDGFLAPAAVAAVRQAVDAVLAGPEVPGCERPHNRIAPLRWDDEVVDLVLSDRRRRAAIAAATGAEDLRWISGYVSVKEPGTGALEWHRDWWCWDHPVSLRRATPQVAVLVYLTDTDERTGALRVIPGSHHASAAAGAVTLPARAGDAVALDYRLLHGTHPNAAPSRREAVLLSFTPSWRSLPPDVRAHLIQHLALPGDAERVPGTGWPSALLPRFDGPRADLTLNREAPAAFLAQR
jgi:ectoine hydroxylase-related dioxygenase (phytanoyl-CoA dioxygenase family)